MAEGKWTETDNGKQNSKKNYPYSRQIDFQLKMFIRNKEGHYLMINGSIHQEDKITVNIYAPYIGAP